jgi:hypothetical protein
MELFQRAGNALNKKTNVPIQSRRNTFPYNNLITCGECDCNFLGETKKKKYIYYHCSYSKGRHKSPYIPQHVLEKMFEKSINDISMPESAFNLIEEGLRKDADQAAEYLKKRRSALLNERTRLLQRIDSLLDMKLDGSVSKEVWEAKNKTYNDRNTAIEVEMAKLDQSVTERVDQGIKALELAKELSLLYNRSNTEEKAEILKNIASNFVVKGENIIPVYKKPYSLIVQNGSDPDWRAWRDSTASVARLCLSQPERVSLTR